LSSGTVMGYASPTPVQANNNNNNNKGNADDPPRDPLRWSMGAPPVLEWPARIGYEPVAAQDPRHEVSCGFNFTQQQMGGQLSVDRACQSQMLAALDGDDLFVLCHYRAGAKAKDTPTEAEKKEEEEEKEGEGDGDGGEKGEEGEEGEDDVLSSAPPRPAGPPLQFTRYTCEDVLCELFPAIAACCPDGTTSVVQQERQTNAKRLFVMSTMEQRQDPNAKLDALLLGPQDMVRWWWWWWWSLLSCCGCRVVVFVNVVLSSTDTFLVVVFCSTCHHRREEPVARCPHPWVASAVPPVAKVAVG
jgi:hypothetical protein